MIRSASLLLLLGAVGCHHALPRLVARGRDQEALQRVADSRFEPRGKAARAFAVALERQGDPGRARAVLQRDFRRGGGVASLVALADLELARGLDGAAAIHYTRVDTLEKAALAGRLDVCGLFERRGEAFLRLGDAPAAWRDVARAQRLCPGDDPARRKRVSAVRAAHDAYLKHRLPAGACDPSCDEPERGDPELPTDPEALRAALDRGTRTPSIDQVMTLIQAEAAGAFHADLLSTSELRRLLAGRGWEALDGPVKALDPGPRAYARLRLAEVLRVPMEGDPLKGPDRGRTVDLARVVEGARVGALAPGAAWRAFLAVGDTVSAEFTLAGELQKTVPPAPVPAGPAPEGDPAPRPTPEPGVDGPDGPVSHWIGRVPLDAEVLPEVLAWTRLRDLAGKSEPALRYVRHTLARARAADVPGAPALAAAEARRALVAGRFWRALAIADVFPGVETEGVRAAAASALVLLEPACAGGCGQDRDALEVERVLGEDWMQRTHAALPGLAHGVGSSPPASGCPTLAEHLAADALGPLAGVMGGRADGPALRAAMEHDVALGCTADFLLPQFRSHPVEAAAMAESLAHGADTLGTRTLLTLAQVAAIGGDPRRAESLARGAASVAPDEIGAWRDVAQWARALDHRELELAALRHILLLSPGLVDLEARRRQVMLRMADVADFEGTAPAGRDNLGRVLADHLEWVGEARRWAEEEILLERVLGEATLSEASRKALAPVLWTDARKRAHALAWQREQLRRGETIRVLDVAPLDPERMALAMRVGPVPVPPTTFAFAPLEELDDLRLGQLDRLPDAGQRIRQAVSLVVTLPPARREVAVGWLLDVLRRRPAARRELALRLARGVATLGVDGEPTRAFATATEAWAQLAPALAGGAP